MSKFYLKKKNQKNQTSNDNDEQQQSPVYERPPKLIIDDIIPEMASSQNQPVISYTQTNSSLSDNNLSTITPPINNDHLPWSDEEKLLLCKTVVKYPPGIPNRWEKIAAVLGRNLNQVTEMANKIKNKCKSK